MRERQVLKKVRIYMDNCLPRLDTLKPISPRTLPEDTVVVDLLNAENQWNVNKLNQYFMSKYVEVILKIPTPTETSQDEVLWHFDKRGEYSVKSGYQLAFRGRSAQASKFL